ncbi:MAG TPA: LysM peptidoglycan-binding domain-containing M23 family metallopeptidase [Stellaceae bacterium]|nr:LysM peptidoglycan-binding domain-containing M23 family metallopeptidase [Stellaceae bacterium]
MRTSARLRLAALLLAALAGCARSAPPAPVVAGASPGAPPAIGDAPRGPPPAPHPDQVVVQQGETLYGVARRYDVPVRSLIEANSLAPPYRLAAGSGLVVPQVRQHIVEPGDTLYSISRRYGVDTSTLARGNRLEPPYRVRVGEALLLPAAVESAQAPVIQATAPAAAYAAAAEPPATGGEPAPSVAAAPSAAAPAPPPPAEKPAAVPPVPKAAAQPAEEKTAALPPPAPAARAAGRSFIWPVHGRVIAAYGDGAGGTHNDGINIAAPEGTAVLAADAGTVAYAGNELRGYGNLVLVKHADGWMTAYAHNSALLVKRGEKVQRGQPIARVGATGTVGEPQLHFEIRHGTRALDPGDYLPQAAATAARG